MRKLGIITQNGKTIKAMWRTATDGISILFEDGSGMEFSLNQTKISTGASIVITMIDSERASSLVKEDLVAKLADEDAWDDLSKRDKIERLRDTLDMTIS